MSRCVKYYEGGVFQIAKSEFSNYFIRRLLYHPQYGYSWSKWTLFTKNLHMKKYISEYQNMNGNEIKELVVCLYRDNDFDFNNYYLHNNEIIAFRKSKFRLPE